MRPHQKFLLKGAFGLAVASVLMLVSITMITGRKHPIADVVFVACQFTALTAVVIALLTFHQISLLKVAIGLAIEGVLAFIAVLVGGAGDPHGWSGPIAWGVFAVFETAALACVVMILTKVSRESRTSRASKAARVTLRLFFPFVGLIVGVFSGGAFFIWLFCTLWGTGSHMDGCGLAGMLLGMWPGGICGLLIGQWLGNHSAR